MRAKHIYTLYTDEDGKIRGDSWTNDNDDDGYPDREGPSSWPVAFRDTAGMLNSTGGCHYGWSGIAVTVWLDNYLIAASGTTMTKAQAQQWLAEAERDDDAYDYLDFFDYPDDPEEEETSSDDLETHREPIHLGMLDEVIEEF